MSICLLLLYGCGGIPAAARQSYEQGVRAHLRGDLTTAIAALQHSLSIEPRYTGAYLKLAEIYLTLKKYPAACYHYRKALQLAPKSLEALIGLGKVYTLMGQYQKGFFYYNRALKVNPRNFAATFGAGYCRFKQELYEKAIVYFIKSQAIDENNPQANYYLAAAIQKSKKYVDGEIFHLYEKAANHNYAPAHRTLGDIYRENGYKRLAMYHYRCFFNSGGWDSEIKQWLDRQVPKTPPQPQVAQPPSRKPVVKPKQEYEIIKICPKCGRLYNRDSSRCGFDGELLIEEKRIVQERDHH